MLHDRINTILMIYIIIDAVYKLECRKHCVVDWYCEVCVIISNLVMNNEEMINCYILSLPHQTLGLVV